MLSGEDQSISIEEGSFSSSLVGFLAVLACGFDCFLPVDLVGFKGGRSGGVSDAGPH